MDPVHDKECRDRLGRRIEVRRVELRLTQQQLADAAGLSKEGLRKVIKGTGVIRELTKRGIEDALSWLPGSIDAILAGGEPEKIHQVYASDSARATESASVRTPREVRMEKLARARAELSKAVGDDEVEAVDEDPDVSLVEKAARLERELRRRGDRRALAELNAIVDSYRDKSTG